MFFFNFLPLVCLVGVAFSSPIELATEAVPAEAYFPRLVSILSRIDSSLKTNPSGGSFEEASRRTNELGMMQAEFKNILLEAKDAVQRGQNMLPPDGMRMMSSIQEVRRLIESTSSGWVRAKPMVVAAGKRTDVYQELIRSSDATTLFGDAFVAKMPPAVQSRGKSFSKDCKGFLEKAILAYRN
jgi:hypothetical protein